MNTRLAIILITIAAAIGEKALAQDPTNIVSATPSRTVSVSQLAQEPGHLIKDFNQRGLSFQGLFINDWSEELRGTDPDGFGRYSLDLSLNLDANKALGWKGSSAYVRLKQHINEFGEMYPDAVQIPSNIDSASRTTLYELWAQQVLFSEKLRLKVGKIDANTEFDQVQGAADFLNSSMGYSPTIMAFPSYPEPKLAAAAFYSVRRSDQIGVGVFRTAGNGILSVVEPGHSWSLPKNDLPGHVNVGYWRLDGSIARFDGSQSSMTQGVYTVLEQTVWRQTLTGKDSQRVLSTFFQFGHSDGVVSDLTAHLGAGLVMQAPLTVRPHDAVGLAYTGVQFSPYGNASEKRQNESTIESYYKLTISSKISFVQDFQLIHRPGGSAKTDCPIITPRVVIAF